MEAEYYVIAKAATEALGIPALVVDFGWQSEARLRAVSSAAKAMSSRSGVGGFSDLEAKYFWVQDA